MLLQFYNSVMNDWLSVFFGFLIILISFPIYIYSIGYVKEYSHKYSLKYIYIMMTLFILSMLGVVLSNNSIVFMIFWELMSITSFFLVIFEHKTKETLKSGVMYFIMTHISGLVLMIMFSFLYKYTKSFEFMSIMNLSNNFTASEKSIIFILAVIGFGAKAGLLPLHAWLPKAHPSAPSNVSALMSGVMLKVAVYGFIRTVFMFLGDISSTYGFVLIIIGTITAIISVLNASAQNDIKKLLAYSSAENIGIIFSVLGLSIVFKSFNEAALAAAALTAGLFHTINHAIFKSLLFACAGSVLYSTGTKDMNKLGGLYKKMRFAACCALIGTAAISAVPPLNGFASEAAIFMSFIQAITSINSVWTLIIIVCGSILALTSGMVMYASVKSFGITYVGEARSESAKDVHKIPASMNIGMGILALYAVFFGVFSKFVVDYILNVSRSVINIGSNIELPQIFVGTDMILVSAIMVAVTALVLLVNHIISRNKTSEVYHTWGCGFNDSKPFMQYSGSGYIQPINRIIGDVVGYKKSVLIEDKISLKQKTTDIVEKYLYTPIIMFFDYTADRLTRIHQGKIQIYISYIVLSLVLSVLLVVKFI